MYADDLVLCSESGEDLRAIVGRFVEVCRRRGLKVNAGKKQGDGTEWRGGIGVEVYVDGIRLEHILEYKYF